MHGVGVAVACPTRRTPTLRLCAQARRWQKKFFFLA